ncbi:MAG: PaaI family thioesterase [Geminicoccaceae bacterium]
MLRGEQLDAAGFEELAKAGVPYVGLLACRVERFEPGDVQVRLPYQDLLVRPGGTICGPAIMALADIALYGLVLSKIGKVDLAVTTDLSVHFLKRPVPGDLIARTHLLKLGRRLAIGEVEIAPEGENEPVAHVVGTYSIPSP